MDGNLLGSDLPASAAVLYALECVGAARAGYRGPIEFAGPDPAVVPFALAEIAAILAEKLDEAGVDASQVLSGIYLAAHAGLKPAEGAGHG